MAFHNRQTLKNSFHEAAAAIAGRMLECSEPITHEILCLMASLCEVAKDSSTPNRILDYLREFKDLIEKENKGLSKEKVPPPVIQNRDSRPIPKKPVMKGGLHFTGNQDCSCNLCTGEFYLPRRLPRR